MTENDRLLDAFGQIDGEMVIEAGMAGGDGRKRAVFGVLAAALGAAAMVCLLLLGRGGGDAAGDGLTTQGLDSIEELENIFEGTLLTDNLAAAGAEISDIRLEYLESRNITDASGWKKLTFTAQRGAEKMEMICTFNVPEDFSLPGEPTKTVEYCGTTVWLYIRPEGGGEGVEEYNCRALFFRDGVVYDMGFLIYETDSLDMVYEYLDMILDTSDEPEKGGVTDALHPLESLMGFTDYRVTADATPIGATWHFWLTVDGVETCVAETFGPNGSFGVYSVDLDGDGRDELVANDMYEGDGVREVRVFRYADGDFYVGWIDRDHYKELGFKDLDWVHSVSEWYDPAENVFVVENTPGSGEDDRTVTISGTEHLIFRRFANGPYGEHFDPVPLTYDEMEHTDARPVDSVFGYTDYRIGIEHVEKDGFWTEYDVWHFWAEVDGELTCLADVKVDGKAPELYSADIDGDGIPELITNTFGYKVTVYRRASDETRELKESFEFREELKTRAPEGFLRELYDPEQNAFVITVEDYEGEAKILYTETQTGLDFMYEAGNRHVRHCKPQYVTLTKAGAERDEPEDIGDLEPDGSAAAIRAVLAGEEDFMYTKRDGGYIETLNVGRIGETLTPGGTEWFEAAEFAPVDMDGDGTIEAVVRVCREDSGDEYGSVVLRYYAGQVYGYLFYAREFNSLKRDGTFESSWSAANEMLRRLEFDGVCCIDHTVIGTDISYDQRLYYQAGSAGEYEEIWREQREKPDALWYELTDEDIASALPEK